MLVSFCFTEPDHLAVSVVLLKRVASTQHLRRSPKHATGNLSRAEHVFLALCFLAAKVAFHVVHMPARHLQDASRIHMLCSRAHMPYRLINLVTPILSTVACSR